MDPAPSAHAQPAKPGDGWLAITHQVARIGMLAVLVLVGALVTRLCGLPDVLRAATAVALSTGLGGALIANLRTRPRLAALWSELTAWIAAAFVIASTWNAWHLRDLRAAVDLPLALLLTLGAFALARATRRVAGTMR